MSVSPLLDNWRFLVWFPPAAQKFIFQVIRTGSRAASHAVKTVWAWSWEFPSISYLKEDGAMHSLHNTSFIMLLITKPTNNNSAFTRANTVRFAITDLYAQWMNMRDLQLAFNVATLGTFCYRQSKVCSIHLWILMITYVFSCTDLWTLMITCTQTTHKTDWVSVVEWQRSYVVQAVKCKAWFPLI